MPNLTYSILGDNSGLLSSINSSISAVQRLTGAVNEVNELTQFQKGISALDKLAQQLLIVQGNASLFGDSLKNQTQAISAYQTAINSLLSNGFDPMSGDVQRLKAQVDALNESIKATPQRLQAGTGPAPQPSFEEVQSYLNETRQNPSQPVVNSNAGGLGQTSALTSLNQQLLAGTLTVQQYNEALVQAGLAEKQISEAAVGAAGAIEEEVGYITQLKQALTELNEQRLVAPQEALAGLNAQIQQTEIELQQATNIGKVGFDAMGNSIRGVSVQNLNGQLFALTNNLFGARQIARDVVRTFDTNSLSSFAKGIGLLAVDFLYYAQNAQFAAGATGVATTAIGAEATVATTGAISTEALGAAFATLLTPVNLVILGIALLGGGLLAYEKSQKNATTAAQDHAKALQADKKALDDYIGTLSGQARVEAEAAQGVAENITALTKLLDAIDSSKNSLQGQAEAFDDLQGKFPEYFAGIQQSQIGTDAFAKAVENAKNGLHDLALANAAFTLSGGAATDLVKNTVALNAALVTQAQLQKQYDQAIAAAKTTAPSGREGLGTSSAASDIAKTFGENAEQIVKFKKAITDASTSLQQYNAIAKQYQGAAAKTEVPDNRIGFLQKEIADLQNVLPKAQNYEAVLAKIKADQEELNTLTGEGSGSSITSNFAALNDQFSTLLQNNSRLAGDNSGLTGYAKVVAGITQQYTLLNDQVNKFIDAVNKSISNGTVTKSQGAGLIAGANNVLSQIPGEQTSSISRAKIQDAQQTADAITKINDDFGVKQTSGYNEELARVGKLYDNIVAANQIKVDALKSADERYQAAQVAANGNQTALTAAKAVYDAEVQDANDAKAKILAAKADLLPAIQAIDAKYIEQEQQLYDKITDIANQAFTELDDSEQSRTDKINTEWQKRIESANKYFDRLKDLATASKLPQSAIDNINQVQAQVNVVLNQADFKAVSVEISKNFAAAMQSAVQGFVSDFYTSITSLGATRQSIDEKYALQLQQQQQSYLSGTSNITAAQNASTVAQINNLKRLEQQSTTSFGAIFSGMVDKFNSTFNTSILQSFTKQFTENLGKTLLTPSAKQLAISPEQQSAQQVATLLKGAGDSLAAQIKDSGNLYAQQIKEGGVSFADIAKQAGIDFYNATKGGTLSTGLLSGSSGGSSAIPGVTAAPGGLGSFAPGADGSITFGSSVAGAASNFENAGTKAGAAIGAGAQEGGKAITDAGSNLSSKVAGAAAALSLAGGLISGVTSPTSVAGQGIGGALKGAGEGALIGAALGPEGAVPGAVIGGLVGLVSGIFGASKAQKELQQQQLEQQQEQTALLKASIAYTSSIVGRDTANGVVTNISVGAFGQLTATISGKDLQFILNRNGNGR